MKVPICVAVAMAVVLAAGAASAQAGRTGGALDECTVTAHAGSIARIVMVRLANGFYSHKAYDADGTFVCDGEWSVNRELNRQAAEILRLKGNDRAAIEDRSDR